MTLTALIVAAGKGERAGGGVPKQFRAIGGKPVLRWAVESLIRHPAVQSTRVVIGENQQERGRGLAGLDVGEFIAGGAERADLVRAGLGAIDGDAVLVHDAARPFCPAAVVDRLVASLEFFEGSAPVLPSATRSQRLARAWKSPWTARAWSGSRPPRPFASTPLRQAYAQWQGGAPTDETTVLRRPE